MNISLDYDNTYTRDPKFWNDFCAMATDNGHTVYCVTMRTPSEGADVIASLQYRVSAIFFTSRKNKKDYMFSVGISIDVWIDDMPWFITNDAM